MFGGATKLQNYVNLCFQVSTDSFFYPDLKYLVTFLQNVDMETTCFSESVLHSVFKSMTHWIQ